MRVLLDFRKTKWLDRLVILQVQAVISPSNYNRPVTITPLSAVQQASLRPLQREVRIIKKILLKAVAKGTKSKDSKLFTLRNINKNSVGS